MCSYYWWHKWNWFKVALVTGASYGIGFAIAEAFLRNKADIIITGRNESKIEKAVNQLKKEFAEQKVIGIVLDNCDVTKMKDIFQNPLLGGVKNRYSCKQCRCY